MRALLELPDEELPHFPRVGVGLGTRAVAFREDPAERHHAGVQHQLFELLPGAGRYQAEA